MTAHLRLLFACLLWTACATVDPRTSPAVVTTAGLADELVAAVDDGREEAARERFASVPERAETLYPALYAVAERRYTSRDYAGASRLLRFLAASYPKAAAVKEARAYSLFLLRGSSPEPGVELQSEIESALADLRSSQRKPVWLDLIEAQQAADRGERSSAAEALTRFLTRWTGEPAELAIYVDDLQRYLESY